MTAPEVPATSTKQVISDVVGWHSDWSQTGPDDDGQWTLHCYDCGAVLLHPLPDHLGQGVLDELHRAHLAAEIAKALATEVPDDAAGREALAELIWHTSRADESTISATGANIVADAILRSDWLAEQIRAAKAAALEEAADDVRRVRTEGLRPSEEYGPYSEAFEQWLRDRAAAYREGGDQ